MSRFSQAFSQIFRDDWGARMAKGAASDALSVPKKYDATRKQKAAWRAKNPEKVKAKYERKKARKKKSPTQISSAAPWPKLCKHCRKRREAPQKRGLCWTCTKNSEIRQRYAPPGAQTFEPAGKLGRLPPHPTTFPPGTDLKIRLMEMRAAAGMSSTHPKDVRLTTAFTADLPTLKVTGIREPIARTWIKAKRAKPTATEIRDAVLAHVADCSWGDED